MRLVSWAGGCRTEILRWYKSTKIGKQKWKMEAALLKPSLKQHKTANFPLDINFCYFFNYLNGRCSQDSHIEPDHIRCKCNDNRCFVCRARTLVGKALRDWASVESRQGDLHASLFCPELVLCDIRAKKMPETYNWKTLVIHSPRATADL